MLVETIQILYVNCQCKDKVCDSGAVLFEKQQEPQLLCKHVTKKYFERTCYERKVKINIHFRKKTLLCAILP